MKEALLGNEGEIIIQPVGSRNVNERGFSIEVDRCFIEIPIELKVGGEKLAEIIPESEYQKLCLCNVGRIKEVSCLLSEIEVGDRVVTQITNRTDELSASRNQIIKIGHHGALSDNFSLTGLGAYVLNAVRSAEIELGHKVLVIGQGASGLLVSQVAFSCGADVYAFDTEPSRLKMAENLKCKISCLTGSSLENVIKKQTQDIGVDIVFVTGTIKSAELWTKIWSVIRSEGKLIIMQPQDLNLSHRLLLLKNLAIKVHTVYREWQDYCPQKKYAQPIGYVRWNLQAELTEFSRMLSKNFICVEPLITGRFDIDTRDNISKLRLDKNKQYLGVLLYFKRN